MPYKGGLSGMEAAAYLHAAGFGASNSVLQTAVAIAKAESGLNPAAKGGPNSNGTYDWGLMQINDVHKPTQAQKTEPLANARMAFDIYTRAGKSFKPWSTYGNGAYKANMEFARQSVTALQSAGPKFERDLIAGKNPGSDSNPITFPNAPGGGPLAGLDKITDVPSAISNGINAINDQFAKASGNFLSILVALVLIILGIVLIMKTSVVGAVAGTVKGALK